MKLSKLFTEEFSQYAKQVNEDNDKKAITIFREYLYDMKKDIRQFISYVNEDLRKSKKMIKSLSESNSSKNSSEKKIYSRLSRTTINEVNYTTVVDLLNELRCKVYTNRDLSKKIDKIINVVDGAVRTIEESYGRNWEDVLYESKFKEEVSGINALLEDLNYKFSAKIREIKNEIFVEKKDLSRFVLEHYRTITNKYENILEGFPAKLRNELLNNPKTYVAFRRTIDHPDKANDLISKYLDFIG